jgi:hypothetical protein
MPIHSAQRPNQTPPIPQTILLPACRCSQPFVVVQAAPTMYSPHKSLVEGLESKIVNACRGDDCSDERSRLGLFDRPRNGDRCRTGSKRRWVPDRTVVVSFASKAVDCEPFSLALTTKGFFSLGIRRYRFCPLVNRRIHLSTLAVLINLTDKFPVTFPLPRLP